ncbi:MAG: T9SS type A sorting domain-containing protein [Bacteroidetes bacterium]|nr:T9SS type A sorting domain-containing protein [Bacteroidota bacterium]
MLLLGAGFNLLSQSLSHQVIVPVAGLQSSGKIHYSQTVGEAAVSVIGCTEYVFTQGFQQPGFIIKKETPPPGNGVKVYPNPVTDFVTIELFGSGSRTFLIDFFNISGTIIRTEKIEFNDQYWLCRPFPVEHFSKGLFLIRILSTDGLINRTFKIEKL